MCSNFRQWKRSWIFICALFYGFDTNEWRGLIVLDSVFLLTFRLRQWHQVFVFFTWSHESCSFRSRKVIFVIFFNWLVSFSYRSLTRSGFRVIEWRVNNYLFCIIDVLNARLFWFVLKRFRAVGWRLECCNALKNISSVRFGSTEHDT